MRRIKGGKTYKLHKLLEKQATKQWHNPKLLDKEPLLPTFLRKPANLNFVVKEIRELAKDARNMTALEIGHADIPTLQYMPFKKMFFMDSSKLMSQQLKNRLMPVKTTPGKTHVRAGKKQDIFFDKETATAYKAVPFSKMVKARGQVITGMAQRLPFQEKTRFGLVVANELFTHIREKERTKILQDLAKKTDKLFILDRGKLPVNEIENQIMNDCTATLRKLEQFDTPQANWIKEIMQATLANFKDAANAELKKRVDFPGIMETLIHDGWHTELVKCKGSTEGHVILKATRRPRIQ